MPSNDQWEDLTPKNGPRQAGVKDAEWEDIAPPPAAAQPSQAPKPAFPSWEPSQDDQSKYPIASALAQEGLTDLNEAQAKADFAANHPIINTAGDILSMGTPGLITSPVKTLATLGRGALKSIAGSGVGRWVGGEIGSIGGPQWAERGRRAGAVLGAITGPMISPQMFAKLPFGLGRIALSDEELAAARASQKLAQRNADIAAGLRKPPAPPKAPEPSMIAVTSTSGPLGSIPMELPPIGSVPQPRLLPPPELGSPENPGWVAKLPNRMPVAKEAPDPVLQAVREGRAAKLPTRMPSVPEPAKAPVSMLGGTPTAGPLGSIPMELPPPGSVPQPKLVDLSPEPKAKGGLGKVGESGELPDVIRIPEPRASLPSDKPGSMFSVPREKLPELATKGAPGAGDVLKNIGVTTLYTVPEGNPEANAALGRIGKAPNFRIVPPAEAPSRMPIAAAPREKGIPVAERFAPDVIEQAVNEMRGLVDLGDIMPKAGRYFAENTFEEHPLAGRYDVKAGERPGGTWSGIPSQKGNIAGQFPWFNDPEMSLSKVQKALAQGKGAEYERIVGKIAQRISDERSAVVTSLGDQIPQLRELAGQVQEIEPDLAQALNDLADGKLTLAPDQLKAYVTEKISDATAAAQFSREIDDAAAEARSAGASQTNPALNPARPGSSEAGPATETPELGRPLGRIRPR